jgi:Kef-type K+ transport system membrane component KefB
MNTVGFQSILILLAAAVVLVALFRSLRLPQILTYLCAGILVGPGARPRRTIELGRQDKTNARDR